jgi:hypothetical protein
VLAGIILAGRLPTARPVAAAASRPRPGRRSVGLTSTDVFASDVILNLAGLDD